MEVIGVRFSVAFTEPLVTSTVLDGENVHEYPAGGAVAPVAQVSVTIPVKPPAGATVTVADPALPPATITGLGETLTAKSEEVTATVAESAASQLLSPR